jgi:hypothetical protein
MMTCHYLKGIRMMSLSPKETFAARALEIGRETGWRPEEFAADHEWSAIGIGPVGQHRDSDARARSNFAVILEDLQDRFGADSVTDVSFGHWGVGWVEEIAFDLSNDELCDAVESWEVHLADYPVASDEHLSTLESEEACEWIAQCLRSSTERDGVDYDLTDLKSIDDMAGEIHSHLSSQYNRTADDIGDEEVEDAAFALKFYVADVAPLTEHIERLEARLADIEAMAADVDRGVRDAVELREAIAAAVEIF